MGVPHERNVPARPIMATQQAVSTLRPLSALLLTHHRRTYVSGRTRGGGIGVDDR